MEKKFQLWVYSVYSFSQTNSWHILPVPVHGGYPEGYAYHLPPTPSSSSLQLFNFPS